MTRRIALVVSVVAYVTTANAILHIPNLLFKSDASSDHQPSISASPILTYYPCGYMDQLECANLTLPLDWNDPSNPHKAFIPVVRQRAVVPPTSPKFGGTIIVNAGLSFLLPLPAIDMIEQMGRQFQRIVDGEKHYEILAFDQRATGHAYPKVPCMTSAESEWMAANVLAYSGVLGYDEHALNMWWSFSAGMGRDCGRTSPNHPYVSSTLVARDMLAIVDAIEANRRAEVASLLRSDDRQLPLHDTVDSSDDQPGLLNFWGFSHGTHIGHIFASRYPDRVGRMVFDGTFDPDAYTATDWTPHLKSVSRAWDLFFQYCFEAGQFCEMYDPMAVHPHQMQSAVEASLRMIIDNPPIGLWYDLMAGFYSEETMRYAALLLDFRTWRILASDLAWRVRSLQEQEPPSNTNNFTFPFLKPQEQQTRSQPISDAFLKTSPLPAQLNWEPNNYWSIVCGDGQETEWMTKQGYQKHLADLKEKYPIFIGAWGYLTTPCHQWPKSLRPSKANSFTGPFGANMSSYDKQASPVLFLANTLDPWTSIENAEKMAGRYEGSAILVNEGVGHTSLGTGFEPNSCILGHVKRYFQNGTLPEQWEKCSTGENPFLHGYH